MIIDKDVIMVDDFKYERFVTYLSKIIKSERLLYHSACIITYFLLQPKETHSHTYRCSINKKIHISKLSDLYDMNFDHIYDPIRGNQ